MDRCCNISVVSEVPRVELGELWQSTKIPCLGLKFDVNWALTLTGYSITKSRYIYKEKPQIRHGSDKIR